MQSLAKEIVRSRKTVNRLYENKAQLNSISMHLGESVGMILFSSLVFLLSFYLESILITLNCLFDDCISVGNMLSDFYY